MEKNGDSSGILRKWWKIVNQEFGEIVQEEEENNVDPHKLNSGEQASAPSATESIPASTSEVPRDSNAQSQNPTHLKR